jgi:hypothetical protein
MRQRVLIGLAISLSGLVLLAAAGLAAWNASLSLGRYPGSMRGLRDRLDVSAVGHGYLGLETRFVSDDPVEEVYAWYAARFDGQPEEGFGTQGRCLRLAGVRRFIAARRVVSVTVCAVAGQTDVSVNTTIMVVP